MNIDTDISVFVKKRNQYLYGFMIADMIILVVLMAVLMFIFDNYEGQEIFSTYIIYTVIGYSLLIILSLALFFKSLPFMAPANVISFSQKIGKIVEKRLAEALEINDVYADKGHQLFEKMLQQQEVSYPVISGAFFEAEREIRSDYFEIKNQLVKSMQNKVDDLNRQLDYLFGLYLPQAIDYEQKREKHLQKGHYKEPLIPPMFFTADDVAIFNEMSHIYKIPKY